MTTKSRHYALTLGLMACSSGACAAAFQNLEPAARASGGDGPAAGAIRADRPRAVRGWRQKTHLVYELDVTNSTSLELHLARLEVLSGSATLASFEGADLNSAMSPEGPDGIDHRTLGPHKRAVAFLWITLADGRAPPAILRHRLTSDGYTAEGGEVAVSQAKPIVIGPPFRGSDWLALNGPANESLHRRALSRSPLLAIGDKERISQRFAIDWLRVDAKGKTSSGDVKDNKSYYAYGSEVLAVADGVVAEIKDGIRENFPELREPCGLPWRPSQETM